jgi:hypothetical protein
VDQYVEMYGLTGIVGPRDGPDEPDTRKPPADKGDKGRSGRGKSAPREEKPPSKPKPERMKEPSIDLTDDQRLYVEILERLSGRLKAAIVNPKGDVIQELDVKDLTSTLKDFRKKSKAIVFDGVITQRLLDIAVEKDVVDIVGKKIGNVTKRPKKLNVWTLDDLSPK